MNKWLSEVLHDGMQKNRHIGLNNFLVVPLHHKDDHHARMYAKSSRGLPAAPLR